MTNPNNEEIARLKAYYGLDDPPAPKLAEEYSGHRPFDTEQWTKEIAPITIVPQTGIGPFKLGMSKTEVEATFQRYAHLRWDDNPANPSYFEMLFATIEYDESDRVCFMAIENLHDDAMVCLFEGIDIFRTKADKLAAAIDKTYSFVRDEDSAIGYSFTFNEAGLNLWRPNVFTDDCLNNESFLEMSQENQELEKRHYYFSTAVIFAPGYYDR
ncbi:hypothetical protein ACFQZE_17320 [Paenibacillus sp. GCM10027627]|uniref:hypothetical protein n=1 Tax=unclassified Paenibacillus TaxID=185978 RepID=UPI003639A6CE